MEVEIRIKIDRTKLGIELQRLARYILSLDNHPDGLFSVVIEKFLV